MSGTYSPAEGIFIGRPPCGSCGANWHLHHDGACPEPYRPSSLVAALGELADAVRAGNPIRVFAARGEVQRLMGHRPQGEGHCTCCTALVDTA